MITLTLPYPISANRYWFTVVNKKTLRAMTFPSTEGKAYKKLVGRLAREQGIRQPLAGPIEVTYALYPHLPQDWAKRAKTDPVWWDLTVQCIDLDNCRKVVNDALNGVAWSDDGMIMHDPGTRMMPDGEARLVLTIKPYERAHPQEGLFEREPVYVPRETRRSGPAPVIVNGEQVPF